MPEGPEIHRVADRLAAAVLRKPLVRVEFAFPGLKPYERKLRRHAITSITARGKALLTAFDNGWTMYSHNQLYGVWRIAPAGERPATKRSLRVAFETSDTAILLYSASDVEMWRSDALESHPFSPVRGWGAGNRRLTAAAAGRWPRWTSAARCRAAHRAPELSLGRQPLDERKNHSLR